MLSVLRVVVFTALVAVCFGSKPLFKSKYYRGYSLRHAESFLRNVSEKGETQQNVEGELRTIVEAPTDNTVPEDDGSGTFGDLWFRSTKKNGQLIVRDTIVNQIKNENVIIVYNRSFPGYIVEDIIVYNVGRQRAFCCQLFMKPPSGYAEASLYVAANNTVRVFVEVYISAGN